jgi:hypothetical protein
MGYGLFPFVSQTTPTAPASVMADRLALIIEGLCHAVARRGSARSGGLAGLAGPFIVLIWSRLRRIATRFARHATIPPAPSRPAKPRPARPRQSRPHLLPRRKAWLLRLVPEAAAGASQFRHFLADPETASLLAAAPQLLGILNPLCRMLGIRAMQAPRPPAAPPPDAAPSRATLSHAPPHAAPITTAAPLIVPPWTTPPLSPRVAA